MRVVVFHDYFRFVSFCVHVMMGLFPRVRPKCAVQSDVRICRVSISTTRPYCSNHPVYYHVLTPCVLLQHSGRKNNCSHASTRQNNACALCIFASSNGQPECWQIVVLFFCTHSSNIYIYCFYAASSSYVRQTSSRELV